MEENEWEGDVEQWKGKTSRCGQGWAKQRLEGSMRTTRGRDSRHRESMCKGPVVGLCEACLRTCEEGGRR